MSVSTKVPPFLRAILLNFFSKKSLFLITNFPKFRGESLFGSHLGPLLVFVWSLVGNHGHSYRGLVYQLL